MQTLMYLKKVPETAIKAHKHLMKAYEEMRGISIPNNAPSKMFSGVEKTDGTGVTLPQQLANAKDRAKKSGKKYNPEQTTRWFNAKDLNKDGVLDEKELKTKAPVGWNNQ